MTISKISHQEIAKRLQIQTIPVPADSRVNQTVQAITSNGYFMAGSPFVIVPLTILDRIVSLLDFETGINLTITSISFRCLIKENIHFEARCTIRFFELVSDRLINDCKSKENKTTALSGATKYILKRGHIERALLNASKIEEPRSKTRDGIYLNIAVERVIQGDIPAAQEMVSEIKDGVKQAKAYVSIACKLARNGYDKHAFKIIDIIPTENESFKLHAYEQIAIQRAVQGNVDDALTILEKIPDQENRERIGSRITEIVTLHEETEALIARQKESQGIVATDETYFELVLQHVREGDFQTATANARLIQEDIIIESANLLILKAQLKSAKDHQEILTTLNQFSSHFTSKDLLFAKIGEECARRGDFASVLTMIDQIPLLVNQILTYESAANKIHQAILKYI